MTLHINSLGNVLVAIALLIFAGNVFALWAVSDRWIAGFAAIGAIIWIVEAVYAHRTVFDRRRAVVPGDV